MEIDSSCPREQPVRTCVGCRSRLTQDRLVRLHLDAGGQLRVDRNGHGRGAWICASDRVGCLRLAVDRRSIDRAMRRPVERPSIEALLVDWAGRIEPDAVS